MAAVPPAGARAARDPALALVSLDRAAAEIAGDGLHRLLCQELERAAGRSPLTPAEVRALLERDPAYLREYVQTSRDNGLSGLHLAELALPEGDPPARREAREALNAEARALREGERYAAPASPLVYGLWIGSAVGVAVFVASNLIGIYTDLYEHHLRWVLASFVGLCLAGLGVHLRLVALHARRHRAYRARHAALVAALAEAEARGDLAPGEALG